MNTMKNKPASLNQLHALMRPCIKAFTGILISFFAYSCMIGSEMNSDPLPTATELWEIQRAEVSYTHGGRRHTDVYATIKDFDEARKSNDSYSLRAHYAYAFFSDGTYGVFTVPSDFAQFKEAPFLLTHRLKYKIEKGMFYSKLYIIAGDESTAHFAPMYKIISNDDNTIVLEMDTSKDYPWVLPIDAEETGYTCTAIYKKIKV